MTDKQARDIVLFCNKEIKKYKGSQHGWDHAIRVKNNSDKIVELLKLETSIDFNLLHSICYLHDIPICHFYVNPFISIINHFLETFLILLYLPKVLKQFGLNRTEEKIILNAVKNHPMSYPYRQLHPDQDLYTRILQDADTLDYFSIERNQSFEQKSSQNLIYKLSNPLKKILINAGLKNKADFLNFPELSKYI